MDTRYQISEHTENIFSKFFPMEPGEGKSAVDHSFQIMLARQADRKSIRGRNWRNDDGFSGPTKEELFQIKAERKKKWKREAEYSRLLEESSLRRRYKEKINVKKYPHGSLTTKAYNERKEDGRTGANSGV